MSPLLLMGRRQTYEQRVRALFGAAIIGYWPLWETAGTVVRDISGNGRNGVYTGVTTLAAAAAGPSGSFAPFFDGTVQGVNAYSASLAGAFNGAEGTLMGWFKMGDNAWVDTAEHVLFYIRYDASNVLNISKRTTDNTLRFLTTMGGTAVGPTATMYPAGWSHLAFTWSASGNIAAIYVNGALRASATGLGVWTGVPVSSYMRIGSLNGASLYYKGWYQDVVMLDRSLSATEVRRVVEYAPAGGIKHIAVLGDSISASMTATTGWLYYVANEYNSSKVGVYKHALSGHSIMANMDTQTAEAASDNADSIIVALGTNDNDAGDMGALQAEYAENLAELRASNPGATVYAMNVLPRWTDVGGGTPVAKDNIRVAIAAACTAQGVTCWDTYTDPWLVAGDTSDGTHPTAAGAAAIAARVLALLP